MKNRIKKVIFILLILIILISINTEIYAWSEIIVGGQTFIEDGEAQGSPLGSSSALKDLSGYMYSILLAAGVVIAVIIATVLGIQFMVGGAEGQAKVKEMLVPFIVGCVIVFGGFGIWKIAISVGKQIDRAPVGVLENEGNIQIAYIEE